MRARWRWLIGLSVLAVAAIVVIALFAAMQGTPPPIPHPLTAAFTSIDTETEDATDLTLVISSPTNSSSIAVYLSANGTDSWSHALLSPAPAVLVLEDGREFALTYGDKDADGMVESGDNITIAGPFDGGEFRVALVFEPAYATICEITTRVS